MIVVNSDYYNLYTVREEIFSFTWNRTEKETDTETESDTHTVADTNVNMNMGKWGSYSML